MARYGLATILEDHPVGREFEADNLPLHISIVDSFEVQLEADELAAELAGLLVYQPAFSVKAVADEQYGPDKDIAVTTLELTPALAKLHSDIAGLLQSKGAILKNPHFNGANFTPHISVYGAKRVNAGDYIAIKDITLSTKVSDAEDANRQVLANIAFK